MNYPKGIKQNGIKNINYSNRGMGLEEDINISNKYYIEQNKAYIYKKPTPIQITKVDYVSRKKVIIKEAFFKEPSTTDYNGIYNGYYIDFEAKETNNRLFPLSNIHKHQIEHIININKSGGICFLIIRFNKENITFLLPAEKFIYFINNNSRKSIPLDYFKGNAFIIKEGYMPRLDYLQIVDELLEVSYEK